MIDRTKIEAVNAYLRAEFPDYPIEDCYESNRVFHIFRIDCGNMMHLLTVSEEFLDNHSVSEIPELMGEFSLADSLRAAGSARVLLTNRGVSG